MGPTAQVRESTGKPGAGTVLQEVGEVTTARAPGTQAPVRDAARLGRPCHQIRTCCFSDGARDGTSGPVSVSVWTLYATVWVSPAVAIRFGGRSAPGGRTDGLHGATLLPGDPASPSVDGSASENRLRWGNRPGGRDSARQRMTSTLGPVVFVSCPCGSEWSPGCRPLTSSWMHVLP